MVWKLKRVNQCEKCPWRVDVDPHDIPNGYSEEAHAALSQTVAEPGSVRPVSRVMACHDSHVGDEAHCVGWIWNQLGVGNNIGLRLRIMSCENIHALRVHGEQHERFEDTLPGDRP